MSKIEFTLNDAGVRALLQSNKMQGALIENASAIRNRCGDGYEQDVYVGKNRANAMVYASTYQAKKDNLRNNTLLKAVR